MSVSVKTVEKLLRAGASVAAGRVHKYRNAPVTIDGITFASKREGVRYAELKLMERAGEISGLRVQPRYPITVNGERICTYVGDFTYWPSGKPAYPVVEDVKSPITRKNPTYRLKYKLFRAIYGFSITEV